MSRAWFCSLRANSAAGRGEGASLSVSADVLEQQAADAEFLQFLDFCVSQQFQRDPEQTWIAQRRRDLRPQVRSPDVARGKERVAFLRPSIPARSLQRGPNIAAA